MKKILFLIGVMFSAFIAKGDVAELRKVAEQGDAQAQFRLGVCYAKGDGVAEDLREAVKWFRKAAEQGDAKGQFNLGNCYANGDGVAEDQREAVKWYRKAAEQGDALAQAALKEIEGAL